MTAPAVTLALLDGDSAIASSLERAAALVSEAFPRPAMETSAALLRWHLTGVVIGGATPLVATATRGGELVGFAGATPRLLQCAGVIAPVHVVSFVCVAPSARGAGLAAALYDTLIAGIARTSGRVLTYAIDGSAGMAAIAAAYPRNHFIGCDFGIVPSYAVPRSRVLGGDAPAETMADGGVLSLAPDPQLERHLDADPRGVARAGSVGGRAVAAWRITESGRDPLLLIESLPPYLSAGEMRSAAVDAFAAFPEHARAAMIPNFSAQHPAVAHAVGLRRVPGASYRAFYWSRVANDPFLAATATTHPVL